LETVSNPYEVRPSGGDALSSLRLALPPSGSIRRAFAAPSPGLLDLDLADGGRIHE
jgi:hypothetical protein